MAKWFYCETCEDDISPGDVIGIRKLVCSKCKTSNLKYFETEDDESNNDIATGGLAPFLIAEARERERIASTMFAPIGWVWEYMGDTHFSIEKPKFGSGPGIPVPFEVYRKA